MNPEDNFRIFCFTLKALGRPVNRQKRGGEHAGFGTL